MKNPFEAFRNFGKEDLSQTNYLHNKTSRTSDITPLISLFERFSPRKNQTLGLLLSHKSIERLYKEIADTVAGHNFTASMTEDFCYFLCTERLHGSADSVLGGLLLSAIINTSPRELFFLEFPHPNKLLHFIGYRLAEKKKLEIDGNAGDFLGTNLSGGTIIVNGNIRDWAALGMGRGKIQINGSCGRFACEWMRSGSFLVTGKIESVGISAKGTVVEYYKESNT